MERGSRIFPPCLSTRTGSRPLEPCRVCTSDEPRVVERGCAAAPQCRKRNGAVTRHSRTSRETKLLQ